MHAFTTCIDTHAHPCVVRSVLPLKTRAKRVDNTGLDDKDTGRQQHKAKKGKEENRGHTRQHAHRSILGGDGVACDSRVSTVDCWQAEGDGGSSARDQSEQ